MRRYPDWQRWLAVNVGTVMVLSILVAAACTGPTATSTPASTTSPTTAAASSSPSATPTPSPTPVMVGYRQGPNGIVYTTQSGVTISVPDLSTYHLEAVLEDGQSRYVAQAGNDYGLKVGGYAGMFSPFVSEELSDGTEHVGGVQLAASVVSVLMHRQLAAIPSGQYKVVSPVPLDLSEASEATHLEIVYKKTRVTQIAAVSFGEPLPFCDPYERSLRVLPTSSGTWMTYDTYRLINPPSRLNKIERNEAQHYLSFEGNFSDLAGGNLEGSRTIDKPFGANILLAESPLSIFVESAQEFAPFTEEQLLHVEDSAAHAQVPVFL